MLTALYKRREKQRNKKKNTWFAWVGHDEIIVICYLGKRVYYSSGSVYFWRDWLDYTPYSIVYI